MICDSLFMRNVRRKIKSLFRSSHLYPVSWIELHSWFELNRNAISLHDDVIKWKHFPRNCEFPAQRPVTWSFDVFFDLRPNKRLSKQPWGWWFETRRQHGHYDVIVMEISISGYQSLYMPRLHRYVAAEFCNSPYTKIWMSVTVCVDFKLRFACY